MAGKIGHLGTYPQAGTPCTVRRDDETEDWAMAREPEQSGGLLCGGAAVRAVQGPPGANRGPDDPPRRSSPIGRRLSP
jgi:hypothetical protein